MSEPVRVYELRNDTYYLISPRLAWCMKTILHTKITHIQNYGKIKISYNIFSPINLLIGDRWQFEW